MLLFCTTMQYSKDMKKYTRWSGLYIPAFLDSGSVSDLVGVISSPRVQTKNKTTQTEFSPIFICYIYGKRSYGGSKTWEPRIWYRVWHCRNCCRTRSILRYEINHRLRVKSLCTYDSLLLYTNTAVMRLVSHSHTAKGRPILLGWRQQGVLEYTRPQSYNKIQTCYLSEW